MREVPGDELTLLAQGRLPAMVQRQLFAELREDVAEALERFRHESSLAA